MGLYRIVLADDHVIIRKGLIRLIEENPGLKVAGEAADGIELLDILKVIQPDMVVVDISMPNLGGIEAVRTIQQLYPAIKILILTMHKSREYMYQSFTFGAHGYLLKENSDLELFDAIDRIRHGGKYVSQCLVGEMMDDFSHTNSGNEGLKFTEPLTLREREIIKLLADGKNNKEIAQDLFISFRTVEKHRANVMKKLKIKNVADLIKYALQRGYAVNVPHDQR